MVRPSEGRRRSIHAGQLRVPPTPRCRKGLTRLRPTIWVLVAAFPLPPGLPAQHGDTNSRADGQRLWDRHGPSACCHTGYCVRAGDTATGLRRDEYCPVCNDREMAEHWLAQGTEALLGRCALGDAK